MNPLIRIAILVLTIAFYQLTATQAQTIGSELHLERACVQGITIPVQPNRSQDFHMCVTLDGIQYILKLRPCSLRAPSFRVLVQTPEGLEPSEAPRPTTWSGGIVGQPGSKVAASILDGQLRAILRLEDGTLWGIQPLGDALLGTRTAQHAIYRLEDIKPSEWLCGSDEPPALVSDTGRGASSRGTGSPYLAEIAFDADVEFYQQNGSSVGATVDDIEMILNFVDVIFETQFGIRYLETQILVRTVEPDPYSTTDSLALLVQFRNYWSANHSVVPRDVAHLMTGKDLDGNIIGVAYVGVVCYPNSSPPNLWAYGLSQSRFTTNLVLRTALTAHELGHNWNACHCDESTCTGGGSDPDCALMCSTIGACPGGATTFGTRAAQAISAWRDSASCLGPVPDCNNNGLHDYIDIRDGTSEDCNNNAIPDECESQNDCQPNGMLDFCDIATGTSLDCNGNGVPDECELVDCNSNGIPDVCDIIAGTSPDCNGNGNPDECDIDSGTSPDIDGNGIPDECAITEPGAPVVVWGTQDQYDLPGTPFDFVSIAAAYEHSLGVTIDGSIVAWGSNVGGQCDVPEPNADFIAVAGGGYDNVGHSVGLKSDGSMVVWGDNSYGQANVPAPNAGFLAVASGNRHILGLKADGSVVAWGDNSFGQCNVPAPNTGFVAVACGWYHSLGLKSDGSVVAWGYNNYGQCNVPAPNTGFVAVEGGLFHSLGLKSDGSIVAWGDNSYGQLDVPAPNADFVAIASGSGGQLHSLGLKGDGSIVAWGNNGWGQLNVPQPNTGFVAVAVGAYHSLGLKADGSIRGWGSNQQNQSIEPLDPLVDYVAVAGGGYDIGRGHSLGLQTDGSIVAWGQNDFGQCNVAAPNAYFVAVAAGGFHSLGLKVGGAVVGWGYCGDGQCVPPAPNTDFVAIAAGELHSLGMKSDGSIFAWGNNWYGQLNIPSPNTGFQAVAAGSNHNLALKASGLIVAWGENAYGQCDIPAPNSDFTSVAAGGIADYGHSLGLKSDGSIVCWGNNQVGQCDVPAPNTDFVAIAAGGYHSLGLKTDGSIVAWGLNNHGQADVPILNTSFASIAAGPSHSLGLKVSPQAQFLLTISMVGSGYVTNEPDQPTYTYGQVVTLSATADIGWTFDHWSGDVSGVANPESIMMNGNRAVTAHFMQDQYTLGISVQGNGSVARNPDQATYTYGQTVALTANADAGWIFDHWNGDLMGSANPDAVTMDGNKNVTAVFTFYAGDINGDGVVNSADIQTYVDVLLGIDTNPEHVARSDLDGSGGANGLDTQGFVGAYLNG